MTATYELRVAVDPSPLLLAALAGFSLRPGPPGQTRLVGTVADDAALHAALNHLQDLRVELLSLRRLDPGL